MDVKDYVINRSAACGLINRINELEPTVNSEGFEISCVRYPFKDIPNFNQWDSYIADAILYEIEDGLIELRLEEEDLNSFKKDLYEAVQDQVDLINCLIDNEQQR